MIYKAKTPEEKKECINFLRKHNLESCSDLFLYAKEGELIKGVAAITVGVCDSRKLGFIEPYYHENEHSVSNLRLYSACEGMFLAWDITHIVVGCQSNDITERMFNKLGFAIWSTNFNQYIKEL